MLRFGKVSITGGVLTRLTATLISTSDKEITQRPKRFLSGHKLKRSDAMVWILKLQKANGIASKDLLFILLSDRKVLHHIHGALQRNAHRRVVTPQ